MRKGAIATYLLPWELYPAVWLFCGLSGWLYLHGWRRCRKQPGSLGYAPLISFMGGLLLIFTVEQTRFDYLAQHMLWIHRLQHLVLHHLGPFLMLLGAPWRVLPEGLPSGLRTALDSVVSASPFWLRGLLQTLYRVLQYPWLAAFLFVGLIYFWLLPDVHFGAMLSVDRYQLMNWSMLLDGLLFWWLIFDPRPVDAVGRVSYGKRIVMLTLIVPPQIVLGAHIALSKVSLYPVYSVCGRAWPISPLVDQQIAGLVTWIPASMMSVIAAVIILRRWMRESEPSHPPVVTA